MSEQWMIPVEESQHDHPQRLVKLEEAWQALEIAKNIPEIKQVRDIAATLQQYAKERGYALEIQNDAAELKLRAERRAGEVLQSMPKHKGGRPTENPFPTGRGFSLSDMGVTYKESSQWQLEASVTAADFDDFVTITKAAGKELLSAGLLRLAKIRKLEHAQEQAQQHGNVIALQGYGDFYTDLSALGKQHGPFQCIYADPPWQYDNQATRGSTDKHYPTMSLEDICALPIRDLAAPQSHLHLWVTKAFFFDAPTIMAAWGFTFTNWLTWCKPQIGLGNTYRNATEMLALGVRGGLKVRARDVRDWVEEPRRGHSEKPEIFRHIVERLSPGPYLELFGRSRSEGWVVWGNECHEKTGRMFRENDYIKKIV